MNFITGDSVPVPVGSASAIPSIDNRYDIGSSTKRWRDGRFVNLYAGSTNVGGELTSLGATKLSLTGGALTGQVTTNQTPSAADQLVHKAYVDTADALQLNLTGGALTGQVTTNQTPSAATQLVPKSYVDAGDALQLNLAGGALTGQVTTTQTATLGTQLVHKAYVDTADALQLNLTGGALTGNLTSNSQIIGGGAKILTFGLNWLAGGGAIANMTFNGTCDSVNEPSPTLSSAYLPITTGTVGYYFKSVRWQFENDPGGEIAIHVMFGNTPVVISAATIANQKIGNAQIDVQPYYTQIRVVFVNYGTIRTGRTIVNVGYF